MQLTAINSCHMYYFYHYSVLWAQLMNVNEKRTIPIKSCGCMWLITANGSLCCCCCKWLIYRHLTSDPLRYQLAHFWAKFWAKSLNLSKILNLTQIGENLKKQPIHPTFAIYKVSLTYQEADFATHVGGMSPEGLCTSHILPNSSILLITIFLHKYPIRLFVNFKLPKYPFFVPFGGHSYFTVLP